jgi:hypothetical protein
MKIKYFKNTILYVENYMINKSNTFDLPPIENIPPLSRSCLSSLNEVIKAVFERVIDCLILVWYAIKYAVHYISCGNSFTRKQVFKEGLISKTTNYAKFSDLPKYVAQRRHPTTVSPAEVNETKKAGFTPPKERLTPEGGFEIIPNPFGGGNCYGNVLYFFYLWEKTHSIDDVINEFKNGTPFEGACIQDIYKTLVNDEYYPHLSSLIEEVISRYPNVDFREEQSKWENNGFKQGVAILEALKAYLEEGKHPRDGFFEEYIVIWLYQNKSINLRCTLLGSIRHVAEAHCKAHAWQKKRAEKMYRFLGMQPEGLYLISHTAGSILQTLKQIEKGYYEITIPTFDTIGLESGFHAIGIIVADDACYILDSNIGIGETTYQDLPDTVGRIFSIYTGLDYSEDCNGKTTSFWETVLRLINPFDSRPILSSTQIARFDLIKAKPK